LPPLVRAAAEAGIATTRALVIASIVLVASVPVRVACASRVPICTFAHAQKPKLRALFFGGGGGHST
jgi:hypothetical protein